MVDGQDPCGSSVDATLDAPAPQHMLDTVALERYLAVQVQGFSGPLTVLQYRGGQSNPTYALRTPRAHFVLRKQPPGTLLPSAHAVDREYRILSALHASDVPVPRVLAFCDDRSVIGTPFYVMEHLNGRIFRNPHLPDLTPTERRDVFLCEIDTLAALHKVDIAAVGLSDFGRHGQYVQRQMKRWTMQYADAALHPVADMDFLGDWLARHMPEADFTTIAHGDFRLANLVYSVDAPRVIGVLDWELATLGHPLADLAYCCLVFNVSLLTQPGFTETGLPEGVPPEAELVDRYAAATGRRVSADEWRFYRAFSLFRLAAISAGVYRRGLSGNASSETALRFQEILLATAKAGANIARGAQG